MSQGLNLPTIQSMVLPNKTAQTKKVQYHNPSQSLPVIQEDLYKNKSRPTSQSNAKKETLKYQSGSMYIGEVLNNQRHG